MRRSAPAFTQVGAENATSRRAPKRTRHYTGPTRASRGLRFQICDLLLQRRGLFGADQGQKLVMLLHELQHLQGIGMGDLRAGCT